ncbi:MAG: glycosyltransferase family 4 protein [Saprospiraceae bacterium]|nr:glycosyltransferase family 4 protein [Saprospiraceae bacterium]
MSTSPDINISHVYCPNSGGLTGLLKNISFAVKNRSNINHVTGDVHYLAIFLPNCVLTIHDCGNPEQFLYFKRIFYKLIWLWLPAHRAKIITVVSEKTKQDVIKYTGVRDDKIVVIPNFIDEKFKFSPKEFNSEKPIFLHIGITPNKNLERVAVALMGVHCELRVIGKLSEAQEDVLKKANIAYSFTFSLTIDQVVEEYKNCDAVIFASTYEGFGLPILEAQTVGRPIVTSNIDPMEKIAGNAAILVNPLEVSDIRRGINELITDGDRRMQIVLNGIENSKKYSIAQAISSLTTIYQSI